MMQGVRERERERESDGERCEDLIEVLVFSSDLLFLQTASCN